MTPEDQSVRPAAVAGTFYPDNPETLKAMVRKFLESAQKQKPAISLKKIFGLISPHAGYVYSGQTAAFAYSLLGKNSFNRVVVVSPSHYDFLEGASICPGKAYTTPLGEIPIDKKLREKICGLDKDNIVSVDWAGHGSEHALEVQLPFLQETLGDFTLLPIVIGNQSSDVCDALGNLLAETLKDEKNVLMVASSDLSHFHDAKTADKLDQNCLDVVSQFNTDGLLKGLRSEKYEACGAGPIATVMLAAKKMGATHSQILHHCNSGDVIGDKSSVVGYMSAALYS